MVIPLRDDNPTRTKPVLTIVIIAVCIYVFAAVQPKGGEAGEVEFLVEHAAIPCEVVHAEPISNNLARQCDGQLETNLPASVEPFPDKNVWLALVVSMFLHGSWLHLLGNMLFLWVFGNNIEERLGVVGYAVFYLVSGVAAGLAHVATQPDSTVPVVGASGAIAGVMGAYLVLFPHARILTIIPLFIFLQFVYLPAFVVLIGWFVLQFFTNPNTGVAVMAHIGGFVFGAGVALFLRVGGGGTPRPEPPYAPPPPPPDWGFGGRRY
ncbi:MAG TPA: rhomboid family intramembrane serine protease [Acidimicrobiia bacterium]|nr:rhomboid family intramembrane serine protease [Acidimicrobiia bacterium]